MGLPTVLIADNTQDLMDYYPPRLRKRGYPVKPAASDGVEKKPERVPLFEAIEQTLERAKKTLLARREVFVVHGHDEAARLRVADFIRQVGLKPIVLCEEPGEG